MTDFISNHLFFALALAWVVGVLVRFLFAWTFDTTFIIGSQVKVFILTVVLGFIVCWVLQMAGIGGWFVMIVLFLAGFMAQYGVEWLNKRRK